tara:strand:+ start:1145 stop:2980 length:1836 start_codon:yes stop_codon:yes gene_type:complete
MTYKECDQVKRLHSYLPFDAEHEKIYDEFVDQDDNPVLIQTKALEYLTQILDKKPTLVILTGDAGHGKTHICRKIIEEYLGYDAKTAGLYLNEKCDGQYLNKNNNPETKIQIYKDFSENSEDITLNKLLSALDDKQSTTIICVNEGKLRAIISADKENRLSPFKKQFFNSFDNGLVTVDQKSYIINLNYQSVASSENNFILKIFSHWLDMRSWKICITCASKEFCPIYRNKELLTNDSSLETKRGIADLFALIERLGVVVTIREALMAVSYLLTGGLTCKSVHQKKERKAWQHEYIFYNLIFQPPKNLGKEKVDPIPVLKEFRYLDPGKISLKEVDDRLINKDETLGESQIELFFQKRIGNENISIDAGTSGIDEIIGNPKNKEQRNTEGKFVKEVIRDLRRRDYFNLDNPEEKARHIGFDYYGDFLYLLSLEDGPKRKIEIKNKLVRGLHTIQGIRAPADSSLNIVDAAFGRSTNHAAIISQKIPSNKINLYSQSEVWKRNGHSSDSDLLSQATDWIDREVILNIYLDEDRKKFVELPLNLSLFDCIMRASGGYLPPIFYNNDIRRVFYFLGTLGRECRHDENSSIDVIVEGKNRIITLEDGGVIQVGES